ncbi:MAG: DUF5615 family PIN-like protein [Dehalococcoidia bacterium]|nr:DUF5615 family PIN-like protein [Dehalococcoidia bacterium]
MSFPVYLDEDSLHRRVARALRPDHDVVTTLEAGNSGFSDEDQLEYCARQGRAIVTANQADFARLHRDWMSSGREHAGIIILTDQRAAPEVIVAKLRRILSLRDARAMRSSVLYINSDPGQRLD